MNENSHSLPSANELLLYSVRKHVQDGENRDKGDMENVPEGGREKCRDALMNEDRFERKGWRLYNGVFHFYVNIC